MTALGNVIALIRQLDDASPDAAGGRPEATLRCDLPPAIENASSLGAVLAFIRATVDLPDAHVEPSRPAPGGEAARDAAAAIARGLAAGRGGAEMRA